MKATAQRQRFAAGLAFACVACGGDATKNEDGPGSGGTSAPSSGGDQAAPSVEAGSGGVGTSDAAGASSDAGGSLSDAGAEAAAAGAHTADSAGAAGEAVDGNAADGGAPNAMSPHGGTNFCENKQDCSSTLECRGRGSSTLQVCLAGCTDDADCAVTHRCVTPSDPLGPDQAACFLRCDNSPLVCPYAFDCYDISGRSDYTCLPRQW